MSLAEYRAGLGGPLRQASLCFLVREGRVLLALKKRGFGAGKWNGVGGKPEPGEPIEQTAVREAREEIGVTPLTPRRVATLDFYFPAVPVEQGWDQQVCVYIAHDWRGEPVETEEMAPRWFDIARLPLDQMWADDRYWLPRALAGVRLCGAFLFDERQQVAEHKVIEGRW